MKPVVSTQQGVGKAFGGDDESLARRKAAAEMVALNAQEKSEGLGALVSAALPSLLSTAGTAIGTVAGGPVGAQAGGAIGSGLGQVLGSMDTSASERQKAEQELENILAEQEGRSPRQIAMQESGSKKLGKTLGGLVSSGVSALGGAEGISKGMAKLSGV